ncbi:hypothetical protein [Phytoactinopolyspora limicola]|nr:hypothetical protein [Phytoactinopolyspora limicola]
MTRLEEDVVGRSGLDDLAGVKDGRTGGDLGHEAKVVANEE